jgi:formiminotetrahydrofolate cyclodeaminase
MRSQPETPFDSVENAHEYLRLLLEAVTEARTEIASDLAAASQASTDRRQEALRLVQYKLERLEQHLHSSSRVLNDLRTLRRLLFDERTEPAASVTRAENGPEAA